MHAFVARQNSGSIQHCTPSPTAKIIDARFMTPNPCNIFRRYRGECLAFDICATKNILVNLG